MQLFSSDCWWKLMMLTKSPMMCGLLIDSKSPNFEYWFTCLEIGCLMLLFVQSITSDNFEMFVGVLDQFAPWLFALDDISYTTCIFRSLKRLPQQHPNVYERFLKGQLTTQKGIRKFSRISDDHAHEKNKKFVKGTGRAIGIFDSPIALAKWMIAGPEIARMLENFEDFFNDEVKGNNETKKTHYFENMFRKNFEAKRKNFLELVIHLRMTQQMYTIVSRNIMDESSSQSLYSARCLVQEQHHQYTTDVLVLGKKSIYDTIKRNKLPLYRSTKKLLCQRLDKESNHWNKIAICFLAYMYLLKAVKVTWTSLSSSKTTHTPQHCSVWWAS